MMQNQNQKIFRIKELAQYLSVSRSTIYNWLNPKSKYYNPDFPKPVSLSIRAKGWFRIDIDNYLESINLKEAI